MNQTVCSSRHNNKSGRIKRHFFLMACVLFSCIAKADNVAATFPTKQHQQIASEILLETILADTSATSEVKFKRGKAILFTIFTGLFGGHRIYLGTHQRTPILYSVTLGGLGILPLIDLVHIIFTKDLSRFENVPKIIMWGR